MLRTKPFQKDITGTREQKIRHPASYDTLRLTDCGGFSEIIESFCFQRVEYLRKIQPKFMRYVNL